MKHVFFLGGSCFLFGKSWKKEAAPLIGLSWGTCSVVLGDLQCNRQQFWDYTPGWKVGIPTPGCNHMSV